MERSDPQRSRRVYIDSDSRFEAIESTYLVTGVGPSSKASAPAVIVSERGRIVVNRMRYSNPIELIVTAIASPILLRTLLVCGEFFRDFLPARRVADARADIAEALADDTRNVVEFRRELFARLANDVFDGGRPHELVAAVNAVTPLSSMPALLRVAESTEAVELVDSEHPQI